MGVRDDKDIVHQLVQPLFKNNFNNYLFKLANLVCVFAWVCSGTCVCVEVRGQGAEMCSLSQNATVEIELRAISLFLLSPPHQSRNI